MGGGSLKEKKPPKFVEVKLIQWAALSWFLFYFVQDDLASLFYSWVFSVAYRYLLLALNNLQEACFGPKSYKELYFGDIARAMKCGIDREYGWQYKYFEYCSRPLTKFCHAVFFQGAEGLGSLGCKKASPMFAYYMGRGLIVCLFLWCVNLAEVNLENIGSVNEQAKVISVIPEVMVYYTIHAVLGLFIEIDHPDLHTFLGKKMSRQLVIPIVEMTLSGQLVYKPIMCHLQRKFKNYPY